MPSFMPLTFRIATAAVLVIATMSACIPFLMKLYADSSYRGPLFRRAMAGDDARG